MAGYNRELCWVSGVYQPDCSTKIDLPLYMVPIAAGYPSPAEDFIEGSLDLNQLLVTHPSATFFVRVVGDSMQEDGIHSGSFLVVDRALEPTDGKIVIAAVNGELLVKKIQRQGDRLFLVAGNPSYLPLEITEGMELIIWGVVTSVIRKF